MAGYSLIHLTGVRLESRCFLIYFLCLKKKKKKKQHCKWIHWPGLTNPFALCWHVPTFDPGVGTGVCQYKIEKAWLGKGNPILDTGISSYTLVYRMVSISCLRYCASCLWHAFVKKATVRWQESDTLVCTVERVIFVLVTSVLRIQRGIRVRPPVYKYMQNWGSKSYRLMCVALSIQLVIWNRLLAVRELLGSVFKWPVSPSCTSKKSLKVFLQGKIPENTLK